MSDWTRQYGRDDVNYETWYSDASKRFALAYTRAEIEQRLGIVTGSEMTKATRSHLRAINRTSSMQSQSAARASSRNVVAALGQTRLILRGALEIYDLFPEHTKQGKEVTA